MELGRHSPLSRVRTNLLSTGFKDLAFCSHMSSLTILHICWSGHNRCTQTISRLFCHSVPGPHSNVWGAGCVFPFTWERGVFLAVVSGRISRESPENGVFFCPPASTRMQWGGRMRIPIFSGKGGYFWQYRLGKILYLSMVTNTRDRGYILFTR